MMDVTRWEQRWVPAAVCFVPPWKSSLHPIICVLVQSGLIAAFCFLAHHLGPNWTAGGSTGLNAQQERALTLERATDFSISLYGYQDVKNNPEWWQHMQKQGWEGRWLTLFQKAYFPFFVTQARRDTAQKPEVTTLFTE